METKPRRGWIQFKILELLEKEVFDVDRFCIRVYGSADKNKRQRLANNLQAMKRKGMITNEFLDWMPDNV